MRSNRHELPRRSEERRCVHRMSSELEARSARPPGCQHPLSATG
jgi:hypothetical protein